MDTLELKNILNQMSVSLPNYTELFRNISSIRDAAKTYHTTYGERLKEEYEQYAYNNVISILGERGSGKSTLFNRIRSFLSGFKDDELRKLKNELEDKVAKQLNSSEQDEEQEERKKLKRLIEQIECIQASRSRYDVNLRLIVPEVLEPGIDILGVILLNMKDYMEKHKDQVQKYYEVDLIDTRGQSYNSCMMHGRTPLEEKWQDTFKTYVQKDESFVQIIKDTYSSLLDYTSNKKHILLSEIMLDSQLFELFTEFTKVFGDKKETCLLYIYMDDVDINRERCGQAIRTVLRYLKHPNVVVFLSGDLEKFKAELIKDEIILQKTGAVSGVINGDQLYRQTEGYVYELMKKVMPYANRYELVKFNNKQKMKFLYNQINDPDKMTLNKLINKKIFDKEINESILPEWAYSVFDEKPRGLATIFEYIYHTDFLNPAFTYEQKNIAYRGLLNIILKTNKALNPIGNWLWDKILHFNKEQLEINLEVLKNHIIEEKNVLTKSLRKYTNQDLIDFKEKYIGVLKFLYVAHCIVNQTELANADYARLLNIIISNKNEKIYPSEISVNKLFELYDKVSQVLTVDLQGLIYENQIYFEKYLAIVPQEEYNSDYRWQEGIKKVKANLGNSDIEIKEQLMEIFADFDYNQDILLED